MDKKIGFVFDLDGTLINSTEIGDKIEKVIFEKYEIQLDKEKEKEIQDLTYEIMHGENRKNLGTKLMWQIFKKLGLNFFQRLNALYIAAKIFKRENKRVSLYRGVRETIQFLEQNNIPFSIATTSSRKELDLRLSNFPEFYDKFQGKIISRDDVSMLKPNPESIIKAADIMNVPLGNTVMVGDMHSDILMGKNVNAVTIAVLSGIFNKDQFKDYNPDFILENVSEIPTIIEKLLEKVIK